MHKAKFWLVQIAMVAILGMILGSPALAGKPSAKGGVNAASDSATHGEMQRFDNANLEKGKADWKDGEVQDPEPPTDPVCEVGNTVDCTEENCPGVWNDATSTCSFF